MVLSASICVLGAQIDCLSVIDNTIYASASGLPAEGAKFYAAGYDEGLFVDAFFTPIGKDGNVELPIVEADNYKLFIWDKTSLAPYSCSYTLTEGTAYAENSSVPVPQVDLSAYTFDQEDDVMIVSAVSETAISGFKGGEEVTYNLIDAVTVLGLSDSLADVVPGSVVLIGTNPLGSCSAIELLATVGMPISEDTFISNYGVYSPSDGSEKYQNVVTSFFGKNGLKVTTYHYPVDATKVYYQIASTGTVCYRVGIALDDGTPVVTYTAGTPLSVFQKSSDYNQYLYFRLNTETEKVEQVVFYCFPKDLDLSDPDYSGIFGLRPIVIIK